MSEPVENQSTPSSPRRGALIRPLAYASSGMEFVAAVGIFSFGGLWLDRRFELLPLFTLVGFVIGLALGFLSLYKTVYRLSRQDDRERATARPRPERTRMKGSALDSPEDDAERVPLIRRIDEP